MKEMKEYFKAQLENEERDNDLLYYMLKTPNSTNGMNLKVMKINESEISDLTDVAFERMQNTTPIFRKV